MIKTAVVLVVLFASITTASAIPPMERAAVSEPEIVDQSGHIVIDVIPNQLVLIRDEVTNMQDKKQTFVLIVQIKDEDGITVSLSWLEGEMPAKRSLAVAQPWKPDRAGDYRLEIFVWDNIDNPAVLSPYKTKTITVPPLVKIVKGSADPEQEENYSPAIIKVVLGINSTVVWLNEDLVGHGVVGDKQEFNSGLIKPNHTWSFTFTKADVYGYHGEPDPWMKGTVIVFPEITEERAIEIAKNRWEVSQLDLSTASISTTLFYVDKNGDVHQISKHNLEQEMKISPYTIQNAERDTYYWKVSLEWKTGIIYLYIINASDGNIVGGAHEDKYG